MQLRTQSLVDIGTRLPVVKLSGEAPCTLGCFDDDDAAAGMATRWHHCAGSAEATA
jgi:hypothetical protein